MRTRTGIGLNPHAHRSLSAMLAVLLASVPAAVAAQQDPQREDVVVEEIEDDGSAPSFSTTVVHEAALNPASERAWANAAMLYSVPPDPGKCVPGVLQEQTKASFLAALNALRARHGLAPVRYNPAADPAAAEAALMMAVNNALSHDPPPNWRCWTPAGAAAAGSSNLLGGVSSPYLAYEDDNAILAEWLIEGDGDEIGHRRWLLDPYLAQTALGRVIAVLPGGSRIDSVVMKVFDFPDSRPSRAGSRDVPPFVAWPQGAYPSIFFSPRARLSFSVSQNFDGPSQIDFSEATISISDGERMLPIRDRSWDNEGYGVANCLSWRADGIVPGRTYAVTVSGIRGAAQDRYSYSFRIVN